MRLEGLFDAVAGRRPGAPFLSWQDGAATYGQTAAAVHAQADQLRESGLGPGDVVLVAAGNRPELVVWWLATLTAGAVPAFVNPESGPAELRDRAARLRPRLALAEAHVPLPDELPAVRLTEAPKLDCATPPGLAARDQPAPEAAAILPTSGSTGVPKLVPVPHAAYLLKGTLNALYLGHGPSDVFLAVMPLFHVGGQCETLVTAIAAGASVRLEPRFSATRFWTQLREHGVTVVHGTATLLLMALAHRGTGPEPERLRTVIGSLRGDVHEGLRAAAPVADVVTLYGMTECPLGTLSHPGEPYQQGSVGRPYLGGSLRVAGPDGLPLPDGQEGELQLRNAACASGYLDGSSATELFSPDGWLRTGDLGAIEGGLVRLLGRRREMIRRGGENIAPAEVEAALATHPDVGDVAVVGHADALRGEEARAFVELRPGAAVRPEQLRAHLAAQLAAYKVPRYWDVLPELPRTASNKVDKPALVRTWPRPAHDAMAPAGSGEKDES